MIKMYFPKDFSSSLFDNLWWFKCSIGLQSKEDRYEVLSSREKVKVH